jgi:hypothetical protein
MSTNLYLSFDAVFGATRPSFLARLRHRLVRLVAGPAAARRRTAAVRDLPPHLLEDLGVVRWNGRLWQAHEQPPATDRVPFASRTAALEPSSAPARRLALCDW